MTDADISRLLVDLVLLLTCAQLGGILFARFRQPPVIGEIVGGLLLGPTVLGAVAPGLEEQLFPAAGPTASALAFLYQLGLLLLMFLTGTQMRRRLNRSDSSTVGLVLVISTVVPFAVGLLVARLLPLGPILGPADDRTALTLVIAVTVAITSIPVIARIMLDLGLLGTRLARVILAVAVAEDIALNVVLAVALGLVQAQSSSTSGLIHVLGIDGVAEAATYHALVPVLFLLAVAGLIHLRRNGPVLPGRLVGSTGPMIVLILAVCGLCVFLGVATMFGAFVVGLLVARTTGASPADGHPKDDDRHPRGAPSPVASVQVFAAAFFVPLYFASVGRRLDLRHDLDLRLTIGFIALACVVKATSVYLAARLAGNQPLWSLDLAVALNARGGPGIVTATVAYDAGIVSATFFTTLILTAVLTSMMAGAWLHRVRPRHLAAPEIDGQTGVGGPAPATFEETPEMHHDVHRAGADPG